MRAHDRKLALHDSPTPGINNLTWFTYSMTTENNAMHHEMRIQICIPNI
jgi:hypothetical protein